MKRLVHSTLMALVLGLLTISWLPVQAQEAVDGRFMPPEGQALFIIGQDLGAIGGLEDYDDGYVDHIDLIPAGLTSYTGLHDLGGLVDLDNWGSGDVSAQLLMDEPKFENSTLAIGLSLTSTSFNLVGRGSYDLVIDQLAEWIKAQERPVYLRIGYEFDGPWNGYDPEGYVATFHYIMDRFQTLEVTNVATVWQSATWAGGTYLGYDWMDWYPGDDYVDWFGMSYFQYHAPTFDAFLDLARDHQKPVMIAEATPRGHDSADGDGEAIWESWFEQFFAFIHANEDVIRALAYINVDWDPQPMWRGQGWGDSRVQANPIILERWLAEMEDGFWLHASPTLFETLTYPPDDSQTD